MVSALLMAAGLMAFQDLSDEQARMFQILDRFDPVDTSKLAFVKVALGCTNKDENGKPYNAYDFGFLLGEDRVAFRVRYLNLATYTLQKTPEGTPEHAREGHTPADLAEVAKETARRLETDEDDSLMMSGHFFSRRARALFLARACARRKLMTEANRLWEALDPIEDLFEELSEGFSRKLARDFFDPDLTRIQLRDRHRAWLENFVKAPERDAMLARTATLERMVKEDEAWAKRPKPGNRVDEIEALVFELRNEFQPFLEERYPPSDHFTRKLSPEQEAARPARKLAAVGLEAVPVLVAHLEDPALARCVNAELSEVETVGAMAEFVLIEISGLEFSGEPDQRRIAWKAWAASLKDRGEEETLAALVVRGGDQADAAAARLIKKWPARVADVIKGAGRAKDPYTRKRMIELLDPIRDDAVIPFLLEESSKGPELGARVMAARTLLDRGRREGLDALAKDWTEPVHTRRDSPQELPDEVRRFDRHIAMQAGRGDLARFLTASGDLKTLQSITKDLADQPPTLRESLLEAIRDYDLEWLTKRCDARSRPQIEAELESILVRFLVDRHRVHSSGSTRLCDQAGSCLAKFWPDRYDFDRKPPSRIRDRNLRKLENSWRARKGLELLPDLALPEYRSKDPAVAKEVDKFLSETDEEVRGKLATHLRQKGLGALPWIQDALKAGPPDRPGLKDLTDMANRLANHVGTSVLVTGSWKVPKELETRVADLRGKELTFDVMIEVMLEALKALPDKAGTAKLHVERLPEGRGVHFELSVTPGEVDTGVGSSSSFSHSIDGRQGTTGGGNGVRTVRDGVDDFRGFYGDKAFQATHDQTFEVDIELRWD